MCAATALICSDIVLTSPFCIQAAVPLPGRVFLERMKAGSVYSSVPECLCETSPSSSYLQLQYF